VSRPSPDIHSRKSAIEPRIASIGFVTANLILSPISRKNPPIWIATVCRPPIRAIPAFSTTSNCSRRSEEHTSELQSRENLVCRLLLEKKKFHYLFIHTRASSQLCQPCSSPFISHI